MSRCNKFSASLVVIRLFIILTSAMASQFAIADVITPSTPNAGSILQEIQPNKSIIPPPRDHAIGIESSEDQALPESAPFKVEALKITGNQSFKTETLHALVANQEGQLLSLKQLGGLASLITQYYHEHNYPLAIAIVPTQTIQDGVVTIQVLEASYGNIDIDNKSRLKASLLSRSLIPLNSGEKITGDRLNQTLLLLNDIPGIVVDASIKKGDAQGTSDLLINATDAARYKAYVSIANSGSASIGRTRANANVDLINPLGLGDMLTVNGLSSGSGMNYGRLSYELMADGQGTRVGGAYSDLYYQLGQQYKALNVHGTSENYSLWAKHPFIRSLSLNFYGQLEYDHVILKDHVDSISAKTDRSLDNTILSFSGDLRDQWIFGGMSYLNMSLTSGHLGFDDLHAQSLDLQAGKTQGGFTKINVTFNKLQQITENTLLYGLFSGQWAYDNLDSSQKMVVGGPNSVRAYDVSVLSGDTVQLVTMELRKSFQSSFGVWQAVAFYDAAHLAINHHSWTTSKNDANLQGVGLGLNWQNEALWSAHVSVATPVGSESNLLSKSSMGSRAWAEIRKDF